MSSAILKIIIKNVLRSAVIIELNHAYGMGGDNFLFYLDCYQHMLKSTVNI